MLQFFIFTSICLKYCIWYKVYKTKGGIEMSLKIYNTMSKREEEFKEIEQGKVKMYTCGPTVYNFAHIGKAYSKK
jgi:hypothetical protein